MGLALKMIMVIYNEAIDAEVMEALGNCGLKNYTKITGVYGRGTSSGTHLGDDIWPGRNNVMYVACLDSEARVFGTEIKKLRSTLGHEGVKSYQWFLDQTE